MLLVIIFVLFVWFGGKYVPKSICKYKEIILGLFIGLILCYFGMGLDGFDVTDPQGAIEFQGSCCNFYDGTPKRGGQFKDTSNPITDKIITAKEQMDACNELPEGSDADRSREIENAKIALCRYSGNTRTFTLPGQNELKGGPAHLQFKRSCCINDGDGGPKFTLDNTPGSVGDECFNYAFGKTMSEITVAELFGDMGEFYEICQAQDGEVRHRRGD